MRIEYLRVQNYRALRDLELKGITPLTVFLGPNGSGKSTIFDVFAFLSECFTVGLRKACDRRGRFRELRTRGVDGEIIIELKYREKSKSPLITYHLAIAEGNKGPEVAEEWLQWRRGERGKPFKFLDFKQGEGQVITGEMPDEKDDRISEKLNSPEMLAVSTLGQFAKHPRVSALRQFITGWYLSYLTADSTRSLPEAGPQERLSPTGDNLPNVIQYLKEQHPERLQQILQTLSSRVPRLERVDAEMMQDGRLLLQIKDAPFTQPILAKFASDGTLKMLAYLTVLSDPEPPLFCGIEEPENHLHPRLLPELAEECLSASANTQLMVTTQKC
ncbi:MAG TPA: AAA family ATPase [Oscillatoriaceae cyanobacterium M33_DOE_052]|uniref:ATPase n=1 Tax=Planktothricoides sp. SpSt-374 TaxID=2282167 RepID=A0A7C3ZN16_9CYAN|nr:AAA family ATPase [Oscillatoriaceae cyanobacterium M33_DOE_052]